jgi:organic radical activating enzyme
MNRLYRIVQRLKRRFGPPRHDIRSLEINLTAHCNLNCYGCGRGSPALPEEFISPATLRRDLDAIRGAVHTAEFKLAGGEPLLHPDLLELIDVVRASGVADKITLITNGLLLHQFGAELWERIDEIWVSAYPDVKRVFKQADVLARGREFGVVVEYNRMNTFTRRLLNKANADTEMVQDIFDHCYQRSGCHSLYQGKLYQCASGPFIPKWLEQVDAAAADSGAELFTADGVVACAENGQVPGDLYARLSRYYARSKPLDACRYCLGGIGKSFPNEQLTRSGVREWTREEHADPLTLIDAERLQEIRGHSVAANYDDYGQRIDLSEPPTER